MTEATGFPPADQQPAEVPAPAPPPAPEPAPEVPAPDVPDGTAAWLRNALHGLHERIVTLGG